MHYYAKSFEQLDIHTLYAILKLRVDVFVVEQNCPYPELDGVDQQATHLYSQNDHGEILAYARILPAGLTYETAAIGRVIVTPKVRGGGIARELMQKAIAIVRDDWQAPVITIGAQVYLKDFYQSLGFVAISDEYLEDGIAHIDMQLKFER
ncbi:MAG: GNAT family N-acetyltransferase [Acinetobacter sp.]|nr:GNAT family N-acetyltransferase [Acinetobacter sp.]